MGKGVMTDAVVALKRVSELKRQGGKKNEEEIRHIIKTNFGQMGLALYNRLDMLNIPAEKIVSMMQDMASKIERFGKRIAKAIKEKKLTAEAAEKEAVAKQQARVAAAEKEAIARQKRLDEAQKFFDELKDKKRRFDEQRKKHLADKKRADDTRKKAENDVSALDKKDRELAAKEKVEKDAKKRAEYKRQRAKLQRDREERMKVIASCSRLGQEALQGVQDVDTQMARLDKDIASARQKRDNAKDRLHQARIYLAQLRGEMQSTQSEEKAVVSQAVRPQVVTNTRSQQIR